MCITASSNLPVRAHNEKLMFLNPENIPFPFSVHWIRIQTWSGFERPISKSDRFWNMAANMRASLWWLSMGLWAALMMILRNCRILMLCLSVWQLHVNHFQTASERHRRRAAFNPRCHNDFLALAWHLDAMTHEQSSGQPMGKQGNVSVNYWLLTP